MAMLLALAFTELALPFFASFLDADLMLNYVREGGLLLPIVALIVLVRAAGGLYPAFYLSRFQPTQVLKANTSSAEAHGTGRLRKRSDARRIGKESVKRCTESGSNSHD